MGQYRKKPVVIEAQRLTALNLNELEAWCGGAIKGTALPRNERCIAIQTLEGEMRAEIGDWIIRGVKGEFYPCKNSIFEATYDVVGDEPRKYVKSQLTFFHAQRHQPRTVPYAAAIDVAAATTIPHILGSHTALHVAKTVGKICTVFEELDHSRDCGLHNTSEPMTEAHRQMLANMSADLVTAALRFANLYNFDLEEFFLQRVKEKNGVELIPEVA